MLAIRRSSKSRWIRIPTPLVGGVEAEQRPPGLTSRASRRAWSRRGEVGVPGESADEGRHAALDGRLLGLRRPPGPSTPASRRRCSRCRVAGHAEQRRVEVGQDGGRPVPFGQRPGACRRSTGRRGPSHAASAPYAGSSPAWPTSSGSPSSDDQADHPRLTCPRAPASRAGPPGTPGSTASASSVEDLTASGQPAADLERRRQRGRRVTAHPHVEGRGVGHPARTAAFQ